MGGSMRVDKAEGQFQRQMPRKWTSSHLDLGWLFSWMREKERVFLARGGEKSSEVRFSSWWGRGLPSERAGSRREA